MISFNFFQRNNIFLVIAIFSSQVKETVKHEGRHMKGGEYERVTLVVLLSERNLLTQHCGVHSFLFLRDHFLICSQHRCKRQHLWNHSQKQVSPIAFSNSAVK